MAEAHAGAVVKADDSDSGYHRCITPDALCGGHHHRCHCGFTWGDGDGGGTMTLVSGDRRWVWAHACPKVAATDTALIDNGLDHDVCPWCGESAPERVEAI